MIVIEGIALYVDVDDTLFMFKMGDHKDAITFRRNGVALKLIPHKKHIEQIKTHAFRGHRIVVWSAGGAGWAEYVVKKLGLKPYVDLVIEKPRWYIDDLPASHILPEESRIYFEDYKPRNKGYR